MTKLEENLQIIQQELKEKLIPNNIKKGTKILGIEGKVDDINNYFMTDLSSLSPEYFQSGMLTVPGLIKEVPFLDTSNLTETTGLFTGCSSITSIPSINTSKVTNMDFMFGHCTQLKMIPLLDTSKVTSMKQMFESCIQLETVPLLDTSKVVNMLRMFTNCAQLKTIPLLNTSEVTNMCDMFEGCNSLSDESLNNILQMCINATNYGPSHDKSLAGLGINFDQIKKCRNLSNWEDFLNAGWVDVQR